MEFLTFPKVNGCVVDVFKVHPDLWNAVYVLIEEEPSSKLMMAVGPMLFVDCGSPRCDLPIQCSWNP
jgi:hypothetical protein